MAHKLSKRHMDQLHYSGFEGQIVVEQRPWIWHHE